ncbi:oxaloacetate decarboxylase subunit gamma [Ectothiorhodospiraceae bacterium BW-2]|nr:oxaloacetate decarboxylase subunit gamma [Ectothiorhodospiraceae bacterium BW-2]
MSNSDLLWVGLELMVLGMGVVVLFLMLLIAVLRLNSRFWRQYANKMEAPSPHLMAVIAAAIHHHRQRE